MARPGPANDSRQPLHDPTRLKRLSISALERYRLCPWIYYVADVLKQPSPLVAGHVSLGGLIHSVLKRYHDQGPLFQWDEATLIAEYAVAWDQARMADAFPNPEDTRNAYADGELMLRTFYHDERARVSGEGDRRQHPVLIEAAFQLPLQTGFALIGRIDRIDLKAGQYLVLDYKSSRRPLEFLAAPDDSLQLALYALGTQQLLGDLPAEIGFYYLHHQQIQTAPYDPASAARVRGAFNTLADAILTQSFRPDPAPEKCAHCDYQSQCPVFRPNIALPVVIT